MESTGALSASGSSGQIASGPIMAVVYSNNAPPPGAKVVADLRMDVATRFSVPLANIQMYEMSGEPVTKDMEMMPVASAPSRMLLRVLQEDGDMTEYEVVLEKNL